MSELINNRVKRIETLKTIVKQLHRGADPESVRQQLTAIVREAEPGEIAAMEQEIIAEGVSVEEVRSMCDLHAQVVQDILRQQHQEVPPGHPADTLKRENEAIREAVSDMRAAITDIKRLPEEAAPGEALVRCRQALNKLMDVDKHYRRKEDLFFSVLERHGITGPSKVMWAIHDDARGRLKALDQALAVEGAAGGGLGPGAGQLAEEALAIIENMTAKEDNILLPMMLQTLTEQEWGEIWTESPAYGWCLVEPRDGYRPPEPTSPDQTVELSADRAVILPTGTLDVEQIKALFSTLPVDITFVDAEDRVRFFSEGSDRIFPRSKAIIGRKVQHCHPPTSVHVVDRILSDFRSGKESVAEFWIDLHGRFIHIRYFAVRDGKGNYLGALEVTQDLTRLRSLQGERRLLQYGTAQAEKDS